MDFLPLWKHWIRPLVYITYFVLMCIVIPVCLIQVTNKSKDKHVKAWFAGGVFTLIAVPVSLWEILHHVINYTQPHLQKYIIRILWMVPIYALDAWFALRFKEFSIYFDTLRECYEAYVIYNFMAYLLSFLWTEYPQLHVDLAKKEQQKHLFPICCLPPWKMGNKMIQYCKHGVLQYTVIRPITTIIALICELNGKYGEGNFNFTSAWSYLVIVNNVSQVWAMYCLVLFYKATKDMLAPIKPIPKFLCVKFVVFFSFWVVGLGIVWQRVKYLPQETNNWQQTLKTALSNRDNQQAVVIAIFAEFDLIPKTEFYDYDVDSIAAAMQDFCICIEMMIAAIAHYFAFSHKPFVNPDAPEGNCLKSLASMWDISDVREDVVEHVKVIGTGMKKTVSGPFLSKRTETERTPLLSNESTANCHMTEDYSTQVTQADVHISYQTTQPDTISSTSDWEVTSVEHLQSQLAEKRPITSSMHNYLENSESSMENQSLHSQTNEHLNNTEHRDVKHSGDTDSHSKDRKPSTESRERDAENRSLIDFETDELEVPNSVVDGGNDDSQGQVQTQTENSTDESARDKDGNIVC